MIPDLVKISGSSSLARCNSADRGEVARAGPHRQIVRRHGFEVVVEHVGPRRDHFFHRAGLAQKIRRQHFDRRLRAARADGADHRGEMRGPAVVEIVAIDRGDDDVGEAKLGGRLGDMRRLGAIKRARYPGLDVAEGAGARAGVAHDHERGVLLLPALADIGATGLLAYRVQAVRPHDLPRLGIARRDRRLDSDPVRLAPDRLVRPMRLFRVAGRSCGADRVDQDRHESSKCVGLYLRVGAPLRKAASMSLTDLKYSAPARRRRAPPPSSSPRASGAGTRCASALLPWSPDSWR